VTPLARKSSIDRLDEELRERIAQLRGQGRTIDEILGALRSLDPDVEVSRSAMGRHVKNLDRIAEQVRQSRAVAEAIVRKFGDEPESKVARANIELGHALIMKCMVGEDGDMVTLDPEEAMFVASSIQKLAGAAKTDNDLRLAIRKEVAAEAAAAVDRVAKTRGLTADQVTSLKSEFLGIARP
jgi:hypothetical protein